MKKLLLTICVTIALCGSLFAQYETHWPDFDPYLHGDNVGLNAYIQINGEFVTSANYEQIEVAAFDANGECRGAQFLIDETDLGDLYPGIQMQVYYDTPGEALTFELWDHAQNKGYTICNPYNLTTNEPYEIVTGEWHLETWDGENEVVLAFTGEEPTGITFDVIPYTSTRDNYYLIASPVGDVEASRVTNLLSNNFDLYYFDQEQDNYEWINYEVGEVSVDPEFVSMGGELKAGRGYLYANSGDGESEVVRLTFPGTAYTTEGGTATFELEYEEGHGMTGWNLMGNPFNVEAYIDRDVYYLMNEAGSDVMEADGPIAPMQGIFVLATGPGDLTFSTADPNAKVSKLSLNLVSDSKVVDRASLSFGGSSLPKFQINSSSTKLYIPMDGEDFAVVSSEEMGEMPVNFKAAKSGSYTLAVSTEVSFNYLHLIDNLTGVDQDLLANPSYSFEASTTDYASRFKLVFATGNSDDTFAFYSNGSFVISNEGEATVQVVDVTGRMLSSETINGSASISVSGAAGVYMIRLVNGENVKVQKVVVK